MTFANIAIAIGVVFALATVFGLWATAGLPGSEQRGLGVGCLTFIIVLVVGGVLAYQILSEEQKKIDEENASIAKQQEQTAKKQAKRDKIRDFTLEKNPKAWENYTQLETATENQRASVKRIESELKEFGRDPDEDKGFCEEKQKLETLEKRCSDLMRKLEEAYLSEVKFQQSVGHDDYQESMDAADAGIQDAADITGHFNEMRQVK